MLFLILFIIYILVAVVVLGMLDNQDEGYEAFLAIFWAPTLVVAICTLLVDG